MPAGKLTAVGTNVFINDVPAHLAPHQVGFATRTNVAYTDGHIDFEFTDQVPVFQGKSYLIVVSLPEEGCSGCLMSYTYDKAATNGLTVYQNGAFWDSRPGSGFALSVDIDAGPVTTSTTTTTTTIATTTGIGSVVQDTQSNCANSLSTHHEDCGGGIVLTYNHNSWGQTRMLGSHYKSSTTGEWVIKR